MFVGRHSELPDDSVAKVIRYRGKTPKGLSTCAELWKREKIFLERLRHEDIVFLQTFDSRLFAVYIERLPESLHRGFNSPFKPADAYIILRHMASAIAYLDTMRITHNDIKPVNIAYSPACGAVLLDFGLAMTSVAKSLPRGTPWYNPRNLLGQGTRGALGDVWALGVTLLYVLVPGWIIRDVQTRSSSARGKWIDRVSQLRETLDRSDKVEGLVMQMLEEERDMRIRAAQVSAAMDSAELLNAVASGRA